MNPIVQRTLLFLSGIFVLFTACKNDDDDIPPPRDRGEEAQRAQADIEDFLKSHYYNYEDFENPDEGFDYRIVIDSITEDSAGKTSLWEQVNNSYIDVVDRNESGVTYKMYYLKVEPGEGDPLTFADAGLMTYSGMLLNRTVFDESNAPVLLDMTSVVQGFMKGVTQFQSAGFQSENEDGTLTFEDFGVGAMFIPSGLGYFNTTQPGIPAYSDLVFTFRLYAVVGDLDHDGDGIPTRMEDLNGNGDLYDDNTNGNNLPNFLDSDDDGDGVPTRNEIRINEDGSVIFLYHGRGDVEPGPNDIPDHLNPAYPYN